MSHSIHYPFLFMFHLPGNCSLPPGSFIRISLDDVAISTIPYSTIPNFPSCAAFCDVPPVSLSLYCKSYTILPASILVKLELLLGSNSNATATYSFEHETSQESFYQRDCIRYCPFPKNGGGDIDFGVWFKSEMTHVNLIFLKNLEGNDPVETSATPMVAQPTTPQLWNIAKKKKKMKGPILALVASRWKTRAAIRAKAHLESSGRSSPLLNGPVIRRIHSRISARQLSRAKSIAGNSQEEVESPLHPLETSLDISQLTDQSTTQDDHDDNDDNLDHDYLKPFEIASLTKQYLWESESRERSTTAMGLDRIYTHSRMRDIAFDVSLLTNISLNSAIVKQFPFVSHHTNISSSMYVSLHARDGHSVLSSAAKSGIPADVDDPTEQKLLMVDYDSCCGISNFYDVSIGDELGNSVETRFEDLFDYVSFLRQLIQCSGDCDVEDVGDSTRYHVGHRQDYFVKMQVFQPSQAPQGGRNPGKMNRRGTLSKQSAGKFTAQFNGTSCSLDRPFVEGRVSISSKRASVRWSSTVDAKVTTIEFLFCNIKDQVIHASHLFGEPQSMAVTLHLSHISHYKHTPPKAANHHAHMPSSCAVNAEVNYVGRRAPSVYVSSDEEVHLQPTETSSHSHRFFGRRHKKNNEASSVTVVEEDDSVNLTFLCAASDLEAPLEAACSNGLTMSLSFDNVEDGGKYTPATEGFISYATLSNWLQNQDPSLSLDSSIMDVTSPIPPTSPPLSTNITLREGVGVLDSDSDDDNLYVRTRDPVYQSFPVSNSAIASDKCVLLESTAAKPNVRVIIPRATDLLPVDIGGQSDPFCILTLVDANGKPVVMPDKYDRYHRRVPPSVHQTSVARFNCNPVWNYEKEFTNDDGIHLAEMLLVQIWDHNTLNSSVLLGEVSIPLDRVKAEMHSAAHDDHHERRKSKFSEMFSRGDHRGKYVRDKNVGFSRPYDIQFSDKMHPSYRDKPSYGTIYVGMSCIEAPALHGHHGDANGIIHISGVSVEECNPYNTQWPGYVVFPGFSFSSSTFLPPVRVVMHPMNLILIISRCGSSGRSDASAPPTVAELLLTAVEAENFPDENETHIRISYDQINHKDMCSISATTLMMQVNFHILNAQGVLAVRMAELLVGPCLADAVVHTIKERYNFMDFQRSVSEVFQDNPSAHEHSIVLVETGEFDKAGWKREFYRQSLSLVPLLLQELLLTGAAPSSGLEQSNAWSVSDHLSPKMDKDTTRCPIVPLYTATDFALQACSVDHWSRGMAYLKELFSYNANVSHADDVYNQFMGLLSITPVITDHTALCITIDNLVSKLLVAMLEMLVCGQGIDIISQDEEKDEGNYQNDGEKEVTVQHHHYGDAHSARVCVLSEMISECYAVIIGVVYQYLNPPAEYARGMSEEQSSDAQARRDTLMFIISKDHWFEQKYQIPCDLVTAGHVELSVDEMLRLCGHGLDPVNLPMLSNCLNYNELVSDFCSVLWDDIAFWANRTIDVVKQEKESAMNEKNSSRGESSSLPWIVELSSAPLASYTGVLDATATATSAGHTNHSTAVASQSMYVSAIPETIVRMLSIQIGAKVIPINSHLTSGVVMTVQKLNAKIATSIANSFVGLCKQCYMQELLLRNWESSDETSSSKLEDNIVFLMSVANDAYRIGHVYVPRCEAKFRARQVINGSVIHRLVDDENLKIMVNEYRHASMACQRVGSSAMNILSILLLKNYADAYVSFDFVDLWETHFASTMYNTVNIESDGVTDVIPPASAFYYSKVSHVFEVTQCMKEVVVQIRTILVMDLQPFLNVEFFENLLIFVAEKMSQRFLQLILQLCDRMKKSDMDQKKKRHSSYVRSSTTSLVSDNASSVEIIPAEDITDDTPLSSVDEDLNALCDSFVAMDEEVDLDGDTAQEWPGTNVSHQLYTDIVYLVEQLKEISAHNNIAALSLTQLDCLADALKSTDVGSIEDVLSTSGCEAARDAILVLAGKSANRTFSIRPGIVLSHIREANAAVIEVDIQDNEVSRIFSEKTSYSTIANKSKGLFASHLFNKSKAVNTDVWYDFLSLSIKVEQKDAIVEEQESTTIAPFTLRSLTVSVLQCGPLDQLMEIDPHSRVFVRATMVDDKKTHKTEKIDSCYWAAWHSVMVISVPQNTSSSFLLLEVISRRRRFIGRDLCIAWVCIKVNKNGSMDGNYTLHTGIPINPKETYDMPIPKEELIVNTRPTIEIHISYS